MGVRTAPGAPSSLWFDPTIGWAREMSRNPLFLAQLMVILLSNGRKRTNKVPPTIAHTDTCGWAKSCSFWGQKVPPERISKRKTSARWCLVRYICTQCRRQRYFCVAICIGAHHATSVWRKSHKSQKNALFYSLQPDKTRKQASFGISTFRNAVRHRLLVQSTCHVGFLTHRNCKYHEH